MKPILKVAGVLTATAAMAVFTALPAFASVNISGNGAFSDNFVTVSNRNSTSVNQSNYSNVNNDVYTSNNTGGNNASFNTGGSNSINTGSASSNVGITVGGNTNSAVMNPSWNTNPGDVTIMGNGAHSYNNVHASNYMNNWLNQTNTQYVNNRVNVRNNTGYNNANYNTGSPFIFGMYGGNNGSNTIRTGSANSNVRINVNGSSNMLGY